jgi:hypothetical protein
VRRDAAVPQEDLAIVFMSIASGWNRDRFADAAANVVFTMIGQQGTRVSRLLKR